MLMVKKFIGAKGFDYARWGLNIRISKERRYTNVKPAKGEIWVLKPHDCVDTHVYGAPLYLIAENEFLARVVTRFRKTYPTYLALLSANCFEEL